MNILSCTEYDAVAIVALSRQGLSEDQAAEIVRKRWPIMAGDDVLAECRGRGLALTSEDLEAFLRDRFGRTHHDDGERLTADSIGWLRSTVQALLDWAVANGRGRPADEAPRPALSIPELLQSLRGGDRAMRIVAARLLTVMLGRGLRAAGVPLDEIETRWADRLADLLERAATGQAKAVDEFEVLLQGDLAAVLTRAVAVADMLRGLRSEDPGERYTAGCMLSYSLGAGLALAGEHREDVELIVGPELSAILGRAMAGDGQAVDELEAMVTTDRAKAHRPNRTAKGEQVG